VVFVSVEKARRVNEKTTQKVMNSFLVVNQLFGIPRKEVIKKVAAIFVLKQQEIKILSNYG